MTRFAVRFLSYFSGGIEWSFRITRRGAVYLVAMALIVAAMYLFAPEYPV